MKHPLLLALFAAIAAEGVAYACSCMTTDDPAELRQFAGEAAKDAVALVEAEAMTAFEPGQGERMAVRQTLAGSAPAEFQVERGPSPSSASCDDLYPAGERRVMILYPVEATAGELPIYRTSGLCTNLLLSKPIFRDSVRTQIDGPMTGGERG